MTVPLYPDILPVLVRRVAPAVHPLRGALLEHLRPVAVSEASLPVLELHVPSDPHSHRHRLLLGVVKVLT